MLYLLTVMLVIAGCYYVCVAVVSCVASTSLSNSLLGSYLTSNIIEEQEEDFASKGFTGKSFCFFTFGFCLDVAGFTILVHLC